MAQNEIADTIAAAKKAAAPATGERMYRVKDRAGLYLRVKASGTRSWVYRRKLEGKIVKRSLGGVERDLRGLFDEVADLNRSVDQRVDPAIAEAEERAAERRTFEAVARDFVEAAKRDMVLSSIGRFRAHLGEFVYGKPLGEKLIDEVTREDLRSVIKSVEVKQRAKAKAIASTFSSIFRTAEHDGLIDNAATLVVELVARQSRGKQARLRRQGPKSARHLSDEELRLIWKTAAEWAASDDPSRAIFGAYIQLLALTGARRSELLNLRWEDVNGYLRFPETKNALDHHVPMTPQMKAVLDRLPRDWDYVFSLGNQARGDGVIQPVPISNMNDRMNAFRAAVGDIPSWSLHSLRKRSSTTMQQAGVPEDHRRLAHNQQASEAAMSRIYDGYDYGDEIAEAFRAANDRLSQIVSPPPDDNVVRLPMKGVK